MNEDIVKTIAAELKISTRQVNTVLEMLKEGDTVPFIARYRKEATGALDEEQILYIEKQYKYEENLAERKESVISLIETQGKLTDELRKQIRTIVNDALAPTYQNRILAATEAIWEKPKDFLNDRRVIELL